MLRIIQFAVIVAVLAGFWKVFEKAGKPGWGSLIPFYNAYLMLGIAGRPGWWLVLLFIPLVNFVVAVMITFDISKKFGKGIGFGFGLLFLPFIFYPYLGFGSARYRGQLSGGATMDMGDMDDLEDSM